MIVRIREMACHNLREGRPSGYFAGRFSARRDGQAVPTLERETTTNGTKGNPKMRTAYRALSISLLLLALVVACQHTPPAEIPAGNSVVRMVYFYSTECSHCRAVQEEVLNPLQEEYGDRMEILYVEIGKPENYELLIRAEEQFNVAPQERGLPTLIVDGSIFTNEEQIRSGLPCLLDTCLSAGGTTWPDIPGLQSLLGTQEGAAPAPMASPLESPLPGPLVGPGALGQPGGEICEANAAACEEPAPVWAAYFYEVGCQVCSRAETDIQYVRSLYPQLVIEEFNIYDDLDLAEWLVEHTGYDWESFHTPAIFIGDDVLVGGEEITPENLIALMDKYAPTGAEKVWQDVERPDVTSRIPGVLTVVFAGLVDGLNPCAFATLVFMIAYLAAGERKGRELLVVGTLFTLGVFIAYLAVGLGFYKILDLLGNLLTTLGHWVYGLTALFCAALAVLSFRDYLKARQGQIQDMSLSLPDAVRKRVRAVIRQGQKARAYFAAAFVTGLVVSMLELACTGQVYLPTIIFIASMPEMRALGVGYLVLYNLLFIIPLLVVFGLAYLGTTSMQLGLFLQKRTAAVKLGTALLFAALALWLGFSVLHGTGLL